MMKTASRFSASFLRLLRYPGLFSLLLPIFYVLHTARSHFGYVTAISALLVIALYLATAALLLAFSRIVLKSPRGAALLSLSVMILFLYWADITTRISALTGLVNYTHLPVLLVGGLATAYGFGWALGRTKEATANRVILFLNVYFLLNTAIEGGMCLARWTARYRGPVIQETVSATQSRVSHSSRPDVYLLLLDEYTSSMALKRRWGFDNRGIDTALRARGFALRPASHANYNFTFFSMASMLSMDYFAPTFEKRPIGDALPDCLSVVGQNKVTKILQNAGYHFYNYSIFSIAGQPAPDVRDMVTDGNRVLTANNLAHVATHEYIPYLRNRKAIRNNPAYHNPQFYRFDAHNLKTISDVCSLALSPRIAAPRFVYAHLLSPHQPFYYDSVGAYLPPAVTRAAPPEHQPKLYWYAVQQVNRQILVMTDAILRGQGGKDAIIIIAGDHGFRTPDAEREGSDDLFANFLAVRFGMAGDDGILPQAPTNVNVFRVVLNKVLGTHFPMLPDRCVVLRGGSH